MIRRTLLIAVAAAGLGLAPPASAAPPTGGIEAGPDPGGAPFDDAPAPPKPPRVREFAVTPGTMRVGATPRMTLRIDGVTTSVRIRVDVIPAGGGRAAARMDLGTELTGRRITAALSPAGRALTPGRYVARVHAVDGNGRRLRRTSGPGAGRARLRVVAPAPPPPPPPPPTATLPTSGIFPVQGAYSLGGEDSRFGAERTGHSHQGHDITAAEGTPLVSPVAGTVSVLGYQAKGAGHYLVVHAADGRDLVFMHLREGSVLVVEGQPVAAAQRIAEVGSTGGSDGAHLHFELWPGGWWVDGSAPIDPLPQLQAWATG